MLDAGSGCIRFIDLFAGIGGIRLGFEQAAEELGLETRCVMTSEIKESAKKVYLDNFPGSDIRGDVRGIDVADIPEFDFLLGGFPCQAFSVAGVRGGFADTRGTMFFEIERILKGRRPLGFLLENVDGLVVHDRPKGSDEPVGRTMRTILDRLASLGYTVVWKVLDSADFAVPQHRRRVYITGLRSDVASKGDMFWILSRFRHGMRTVGDILESGLPTSGSDIVRSLLSKYSAAELEGKQLTDKRGGRNNIHSWDIMDTTAEEREFLETLLHVRRRKRWAEEAGIEWQDGMPLTIGQIRSFWNRDGLEPMLERLVSMNILKKDYPKRLADVNGVTKRRRDTSLEPGYNIVTIKFRYELYRILDRREPSPTLTATDSGGLFVVDGDGVRGLTGRECLRLFGFPETFSMTAEGRDVYDLVGNSVTVPVIRAVAIRLLSVAFCRAEAFRRTPGKLF